MFRMDYFKHGERLFNKNILKYQPLQNYGEFPPVQQRLHKINLN